MAKSFSHIFNFPYTIIRPSALYGERCVSRRVGQIFIENAIQNLDITINGNGEDELDFTYIEDLINELESPTFLSEYHFIEDNGQKAD